MERPGSPKPDAHDRLAEAWRQFMRNIETVRTKADALAKRPTNPPPKR